MEASEPQLTFGITYYPVFQNIRKTLRQLHLLLAPDKEHQKVFPNVPVAGFCNGNSLKGYLVRVALPKKRSGPCGKKTCFVNKNYYNFYNGNLRGNF